MIIRHPRSYSGSNLVSTLVTIGNLGNMENKTTGSKGSIEAFDGSVSTWDNSAITTASDTNDGILGMDWSGADQYPLGKKIEKVVVKGSTNHGLFVTENPTDMDIDIELWDGDSWNNVGNAGTFTDSNSIVKSITSSDQTTLFFKGRALVSSGTSGLKHISEIEFHEVGGGIISFNTIDASYNMQHSTQGSPLFAFNGITTGIGSTGAITTAENSSDAILGVRFNTPRRIEKGIFYSSSNVGMFQTGNPTDCKLYLEGDNGSSWESLGDTGAFTDSDSSYSKEIISTDQLTLFDAVRVVMESATSSNKYLIESQFYVLI